MRAATLEAQDTKTSQGQRSNEAIVADIETVTSPLQIMDKVTPPYSLLPDKCKVHSFIELFAGFAVLQMIFIRCLACLCWSQFQLLKATNYSLALHVKFPSRSELGLDWRCRFAGSGSLWG